MINDRHRFYNINSNSNNDDNSNDKLGRIDGRHYSSLRERTPVRSLATRFQCQQCEKIFTDSSILHQHFKSVHTTSRSHSCPECNKNFASSSGLKQHQHIHNSIKPFQCEVCLKAYTQFSNLCRHKRMHADCRQQIKCLDCGQAFSTLMSLNKHRRFCEGVIRHCPTSSVGFLPLNLPLSSSPHALGIDGSGDGGGAIVSPQTPAALYQNLGALEAWCMHICGIRPSGPLCPSPGYMAAAAAACLPPYPSQSMLAAQYPQMLLGPYMGFLPLDEMRRQVAGTPKINTLRQSSSDEKRIFRDQPTTPSHDSSPSVKASKGHASWTPDIDLPEENSEVKDHHEVWSVEKQKSLKREKVDVEEEKEEETALERSSPSHPYRTSSTSPSQRTFTSPDQSGFSDDQSPLDLSIKPKRSEDLTTAASPSKRYCPGLAETTRSFGRSRLESLDNGQQPAKDGQRGKDRHHQNGPFSDKHSAFSKKTRFALGSSSYVPGTSFLSPVYHLRKELVAPYARDPSKVLSLNQNDAFHLTGSELDNISNIRGFVGKADADLRSTLISPLVKLPDILSFKSSKPRYRYSCRYCGKVFPRSANLTRHLRTHTGEQPYRCKYCKRCFSISSNLQRHVRNIHNKEKPFRCPLCERCFGQQTNLDRHIKKHDTESESCAYSMAEYFVQGKQPATKREETKCPPRDVFFKDMHRYFASSTSPSASSSFRASTPLLSSEIASQGKESEVRSIDAVKEEIDGDVDDEPVPKNDDNHSEDAWKC